MERREKRLRYIAYLIENSLPYVLMAAVVVFITILIK